MNLACMSKVGWRLLTEHQDLGTGVVQTKYIKGRMDIGKITNGIVSTVNLLKKGV